MAGFPVEGFLELGGVGDELVGIARAPGAGSEVERLVAMFLGLCLDSGDDLLIGVAVAGADIEGV